MTTVRTPIVLDVDTGVDDACALLLTAQRIQSGEAIAIPDNAPRDARGLRMAIHY